MGDSPRRSRRAAPWLHATLVYAAFAIVQTWPLAISLTKVLPNDLGDPVLNAWILWWNAHTVPFTATWWNAPAFWPSTGTLAFSEALLGLSPITTPIQWMGGSAITAYNIAFLLTFPLSALAAHALVHRLTGRHDAGLVAGLIYGFNPFRTAHFPQIQVMTSYWMPLALLALHEYLETRRARWLCMFAIAWLMQALSNGYYLLFFPVLVGLWLVWFALSRSTIRVFAAVTVALVTASLPLVPLLWTYRRIHEAFNFQRDLGEVSGFGADVFSLIDASPLLKFWQLHAFHQAEGELFPGATAALLVVLIVVHWLWAHSPLRPGSDRVTVPRAAWVFAAAALVFLAFALSAVVAGPWSITVGRITLLSVRQAGKPFSTGGMLLLAALGVTLLRPVADAWQRKSALMFYALAMGLMYLLCFGPEPRLLGMPFMYRGPYRLLMALPGYDSIRVPARFAMLAVLCLSVVAGLAFARLTRRAGRIARLVLAGAAVCGVVADSAIGEMPLKALPQRLFSFESLPPGTAVLELPLGDSSADVEAMFRGMYHRRPVVNGYSGFFPRGYDVLRRGLEARDPLTFDSIAAWGPLVVMVETARDPGGLWQKQLESRPGAMLLGEEEGRKVYSLPGGDHPPIPDVTNRLPIEAIAASVNNDRIALAVDGNPYSRWDSGPQHGTEVVTIDLGAEYNVDALMMTIGPYLSDFPRRLVIETSGDKIEWTTRWEGSTAAVAFAGAIREPTEVPLTFALAHVPARWIRLRQLGQDPVYYWSILELRLFGE